MNLGTVSDDGKQVYVVEVRLCVLCCRMFCLNLEKYQQVYMREHEEYIYAHTNCPPNRVFKDIPWTNKIK
jgi:hypothetical protein